MLASIQWGKKNETLAATVLSVVELTLHEWLLNRKQTGSNLFLCGWQVVARGKYVVTA